MALSLAARSVCPHKMLLVRSVTGGFYDHGNIRKIPGFRKPPTPHEDLLIENDGRYPPHLKIDMDHPENWPKHYPPFYESRRPNKWPLFRAVMLGFSMYIAYMFWACPAWLLPWATDGFSCIAREDNWVKLEEHPAEDRMYPWQEPLIEDPSPEARRALGWNVPCEGETDFSKPQ